MKKLNQYISEKLRINRDAANIVTELDIDILNNVLVHFELGTTQYIIDTDHEKIANKIKDWLIENNVSSLADLKGPYVYLDKNNYNVSMQDLDPTIRKDYKESTYPKLDKDHKVYTYQYGALLISKNIIIFDTGLGILYFYKAL